MRYILKIKADKTLDSVIDDLSMNNAIKLNALHKIIVDTETHIVTEGSIVLIPDGAFHKVWNTYE